MMSIGKRIQDIRKKQAITQEQLAEALNVSRQSISKWESDKSNPDVFSIIKMSDLYRISTDYILKGEEAPESDPQIAKVPITVPFYKETTFKKALSILMVLGGFTLLLILFIAAMSILN